MTTVEVSNEYEYLTRLVDWFSVFLPEKRRLGPEEKRFFIEHVLLANRNVNLSSKQAVAGLANSMGFPKTYVYRYRTKLKKKLWLRQTETGYVIPSFFMFKDGIPKETTLTVTFINNEPEE